MLISINWFSHFNFQKRLFVFLLNVKVTDESSKIGKFKLGNLFPKSKLNPRFFATKTHFDRRQIRDRKTKNLKRNLGRKCLWLYSVNYWTFKQFVWNWNLNLCLSKTKTVDPICELNVNAFHRSANQSKTSKLFYTLPRSWPHGSKCQ